MFHNLSKKILANALRFLSIDAIQLANSGHPGMPMGMADIAEVLWSDFLVHNPTNPNWINRDRFILSNGHGSMLHYALLHLTGYDITIKDLQQFRQLYSKTPGHPEYHLTPGVEATTGPLGQGIGMAVGMAIAEKLLAKTFNRENFNIIDHYTYCFAGDGCLMEGISHEVCSLAGTLGLNKLILFWDNNQISIDGKTDSWFSEDVSKRFAAYNWHVVENINGHDSSSIKQAIELAKTQKDKPSLLCCKTVIGYGAPSVSGSEKSHGTPLGIQEVAAARKSLGWEYPTFFIPQEIYQAWDAKEKGTLINNLWEKKKLDYKSKYPELCIELDRRHNAILPADWQEIINNILKQALDNPRNIATREASKFFLDNISNKLPELFGGSADLSHSNLTLFNDAKPFDIKMQDQMFNYLHYGVREFGMFSIINGIALHKGFIPYGGTFLAFVDYAKAALRLSAIMHQKVIYVLTHDSIGLGEDGPTHQPIEQLSALRMIPNVSVWRPCDTIETIIAWQHAIQTSKQYQTSCLILSRQSLVQQNRSMSVLACIKQGGYVIQDNLNPQAIILATGSEVEIAIQAAKQLMTDHHIEVRVVSMPNMNIFLQQPLSYQEEVLPSNIVARVAIEAANTFIWHKFVGLNGKVIGIDRFGLSAPGSQIYHELQINIESVKRAVLDLININNYT
jgi:transketolase